MYFSYGENETQYLKSRDPKLGAVIDAVGHVYRETDHDLFSSVVHQIVGQQISTKALASIWGRMGDALGQVNAETVSAADRDFLQGIGISYRKVDYIKEFAGKVTDGSFDLESIWEMPDADAIARLTSLRGIGVWTAEMILLFCMERPDVLSRDDLAIQRGLRMVYHHRTITDKLFEKYRRRYSPCGSVASLYLWAVASGAVPEMKIPTNIKTLLSGNAVEWMSSTIMPSEEEKRDLYNLANQIPFDDRINHEADITDLNITLIQAYLKEVGSSLFEESKHMDFLDLCKNMNIVNTLPEYTKPKNVGLMFFSLEPEKFFPYAQIDVVQFPDDLDGDRIIENTFRGPLHNQLRSALLYIKGNVIEEQITKFPDRAEADHVFNYPYAAVEESLCNAVYHKGYDVKEPIEVRVLPDRIEIVSHPGADRSVTDEGLKNYRVFNRRYRNRRIGEFLKELQLTEGRNTGFRKIVNALRQNGSPLPLFETDPERLSFCTTLYIHPLFLNRDEDINDENADINGKNEGISEDINWGCEHVNEDINWRSEDINEDINWQNEDINRESEDINRHSEDINEDINWHSEDINEGINENGQNNTGANSSSASELSNAESLILQAVKSDPSISVVGMSVQLNIPKSTVERALKSLRSKQLIDRVGSRKTGKWVAKK